MTPSDYPAFLADLKTRIRQARTRAALSVNRELIALYWQIGRAILENQERQGWGAKVVQQLADDLRLEFPDMKGFSRANLLYMRAFAEAYPDESIVQQLVDQLPWGHNITLLTRFKDAATRDVYTRAALEFGWSRNVLELHIKSNWHARRGQATTNFARTLPEPGWAMTRTNGT